MGGRGGSRGCDGTLEPAVVPPKEVFLGQADMCSKQSGLEHGCARETSTRNRKPKSLRDAPTRVEHCRVVRRHGHCLPTQPLPVCRNRLVQGDDCGRGSCNRWVRSVARELLEPDVVRRASESLLDGREEAEPQGPRLSIGCSVDLLPRCLFALQHSRSNIVFLWHDQPRALEANAAKSSKRRHCHEAG
jgi:hypothetical protein